MQGKTCVQSKMCVLVGYGLVDLHSHSKPPSPLPPPPPPPPPSSSNLQSFVDVRGEEAVEDQQPPEEPEDSARATSVLPSADSRVRVGEEEEEEEEKEEGLLAAACGETRAPLN